MYLLFATFILLCGSTHFFDALMFWIPMYRFNALLRLVTGVVSLFTVYYLFRVLPDLFNQRTNVELEREIARREDAERKLAEANEGLQAFAYIASHDLQEPLRKISTFTSLLRDANKDKFDEQSHIYAEKVENSANRMQGLIQDVLSLSTITDEVHLNKVNMREVVEKAVEDLEMKIQEKRAIINIENLPHVFGNYSYLRQLFYNLISNSIKFSTKPPVVIIRGEQQNGNAIIKIKDNGIGMSEKDHQKVFEAFQRLHNKSVYEGTGIGLAIVKRIVEVHCGSIKIDSTEGMGTTFTIELKSAQEV